MPLTVASIISIVPTNLWVPLKKFVTKDATIVFDLPFKLSTKYTPALLIVLMCLSLGNQFVRSVEFGCSSAYSPIQSSNGYSGNNQELNKDLNDFCWNHETFLVVKALAPQMKNKVTYPGVAQHNRGDDIFTLRYYKYVWLILAKLAVIAFLPHYFWKARATRKIQPLVVIKESAECSEDYQRSHLFLETTGFNGSFAWFYIGCKIFGTLSPIGQWYYLCGFLGKPYQLYGFDVVSHFMDEQAPWPNPMDALFPKMSKCEWSRYGFGGDIEVQSAQCLMPMNNITQWSFFVVWWWMAIVFVVNVISVIYLLIHTFSCFRQYKWRKYVTAVCRKDISKLRNMSAVSNGKKIKKTEKRYRIYINMEFGDDLVLSLIKKNLEEWKFRAFVHKIATTDNSFMQLKQMLIDDKNEEGNPQEREQLVENMEIGFKSSIINQNEKMEPLPAIPFIQNKTPVKVDRKLIVNHQDKSNTSGKEKTIPGSDYGWAVPEPSKHFSRNDFDNQNNEDDWDEH